MRTGATAPHAIVSREDVEDRTAGRQRQRRVRGLQALQASVDTSNPAIDRHCKTGHHAAKRHEVLSKAQGGHVLYAKVALVGSVECLDVSELVRSALRRYVTIDRRMEIWT